MVRRLEHRHRPQRRVRELASAAASMSPVSRKLTSPRRQPEDHAPVVTPSSSTRSRGGPSTRLCVAHADRRVASLDLLDHGAAPAAARSAVPAALLVLAGGDPDALGGERRHPEISPSAWSGCGWESAASFSRRTRSSAR